MNKLKTMKSVRKGWGWEYWYVNGDYCMKEIEIYQHKGCSIHHHEKKDEVFYCVKGKILLEVGIVEPESEERLECVILEPGDAYRVEPYVKHRFIGLDENNTLIESSTHHEDSDSIRLIRGGIK